MKKTKIFDCPKCNQDLHYYFFLRGVHICGLTVSNDCLTKMRDCFKRFVKEMKEILLKEFMTLGLLKNRRIAYEKRIERK